MTAPVGVLAVMDRALHFSKHGKAIDSDSLREASAAVAELIERERKAREALALAVEKADRIGGDMKYSDFAHVGHPNGECAWYIAAKGVLAEGGAT